MTDLILVRDANAGTVKIVRAPSAPSRIAQVLGWRWARVLMPRIV
jgi:hypothetical protein